MLDTNHTEHNSVILHALNATALQAKVLYKVINCLMVTSQGGRAFAKRKLVLKSLQILHSLSVVV